MHLIQQVSLCPPLVQSVRLLSFKYRGVTMLTGFPRTRWPRLRFSESYAVRISVKISQICEFRVIMGIITGLLGCCSSSTLGSRANDYVKILATLGFWLHHSPCSLGCWTINTLAARSLSPKSFISSRALFRDTFQCFLVTATHLTATPTLERRATYTALATDDLLLTSGGGSGMSVTPALSIFSSSGLRSYSAGRITPFSLAAACSISLASRRRPLATRYVTDSGINLSKNISMAECKTAVSPLR